MEGLINEGYLVDARYYSTCIPKLAGVKTTSGDFNQKELSAAVDTSEIVGDIPNHYIKYGEGRPALCFAVTVKHSNDIVSAFETRGIPARHIDANSTDAERAEAVADLRTGALKVIVNVGIYGTGVDIPFLGVVIMARPTKSLILFIQQCGRGTRTFDGDEYNKPKTDFIILDHAGNVPRHGFITTEYEANLEKDEKKKKLYEKTASVKICRDCYFIYASGTVCPACGASTPAKEYETKNGNLKEIPLVAPELRAYRELKIQAKREGRPRRWIFHRLNEKFGTKVAEEFVPPLTEAQKNFLNRKRLISAANDLLKGNR